MTTTAGTANRGCRRNRGQVPVRTGGPWPSVSCRRRRTLPRSREILDPDFREPVLSPVHQLADIAERDRLPFAVDDRRLAGGVVPAALLFADVFGKLANIEQLVGEQER